MPRVIAPAKIHGGKFYLASKILELFPPRTAYNTYVEDYGGMGSVLLAHDPEGKSEVFNDMDGDISNFFEVLRDPKTFEDFMRHAAVSPFSELLFKASLGCFRDATLPCAERAFRFFVICRQSRAGNRKQFATSTKSRLRRGMNEQVSAWLSSIDNLPEVHARFQRVQIRSAPAVKLIQEFDAPNIVHYLDPPYYPEARQDTDAYGALDMTVEDHEELIKVIKVSRSKILLSGYHNELYDKELQGKKWNVVEFVSPNHVSGAKQKRRMVECIWRNYQ